MTQSSPIPVAFACVGSLSAALAAGGAATAQNARPADGMSETGRSAEQITCAALTEMDPERVPSLLYFVSGHGRGLAEALDLTERARSQAEEDEEEAGSGAGERAGAQEASDGGAVPSGSGGTLSAGGARVDGFFEIPIAEVMSTCEQALDRRVSDVLEEQRGGDGARDG